MWWGSGQGAEICMPARRAPKSATKPKSPKPAAASPRSRIAAKKVAAAVGVEAVADLLRGMGLAQVREDMGRRYGITGPTAEAAYGVPVGTIREIAKRLVKELGGKKGGPARHELALALWTWKGGQYEARMLAAFVDDPAEVTAAQMDAWAKGFDNWGICDTVCFHLFDKVPPKLAFAKVRKWAASKDEFVKRGAFALVASMALHVRPKDSEEPAFLACLPLAQKAAADERNFVKKGVSWALRGTGRRTPGLKNAVLQVAKELAASEIAAERWVGRNVSRDLNRTDLGSSYPQ